MTSGKKRRGVIACGQIDMREYLHSHIAADCRGDFRVVSKRNVPYPMSVLGVVMVPEMPFIHCPKCQASFVPESFQHFLERLAAAALVTNGCRLAPGQIRFLRIAFDLSQATVAKAIDVTRTYIAKIESTTSGERLGEDKQIRLKLFYAKMLRVTDADALYRIAEPHERPPFIGLDRSQIRTEIRRMCGENGLARLG